MNYEEYQEQYNLGEEIGRETMGLTDNEYSLNRVRE